MRIPAIVNGCVLIVSRWPVEHERTIGRHLKRMGITIGAAPPRFLVSREGKVAALLDAKYRDLWERDLPPDMLYQLAIYALSQPKSGTAAILFPTIIAGATAAVIEIRDPVRAGALGYVALRPVPLGELLEAVRVDGDPERVARGIGWGDSQFGSLTVVQ